MHVSDAAFLAIFLVTFIGGVAWADTPHPRRERQPNS